MPYRDQLHQNLKRLKPIENIIDNLIIILCEITLSNSYTMTQPNIDDEKLINAQQNDPDSSKMKRLIQMKMKDYFHWKEIYYLKTQKMAE